MSSEKDPNLTPDNSSQNENESDHSGYAPTHIQDPSEGTPNDPKTAVDSLAQQNAQIGPYRLLQPLGEGGMGTVWLAEQEQPVKRRVALKLIKSELPSKEVLARFDAEKQALAMMRHPNIERVIDAGTTDEGRPYFVMEWVDGIPITEHCDNNKGSVDERLKLFVSVCKAVQHAHLKGIIHRDLKPSNVLVTFVDGEAAPKVIDFGLAKAVEHNLQLTDATMLTQFGKVVGTLMKNDPDQASFYDGLQSSFQKLASQFEQEATLISLTGSD